MLPEREGERTMSSLLLMLIAILVLGGGYLLYGRYLERK